MLWGVFTGTVSLWREGKYHKYKRKLRQFSKLICVFQDIEKYKMVLSLGGQGGKVFIHTVL